MSADDDAVKHDIDRLFDALAGGARLADLARERFCCCRSTLYAQALRYQRELGAKTLTQAVVLHDRRKRG